MNLLRNKYFSSRVYPPCCADSNWVEGTQRCFQVLFWLYIPNVALVVHTQRCSSSKAAALLGCGYPTLLRLIWVVDTRRGVSLSGLQIPNVAAALLGCRYPTLLRLIWVVDTQRCFGLFGLWTPNVVLAYLGCRDLTLLRLIQVVDSQRCVGLSQLYLECNAAHNHWWSVQDTTWTDLSLIPSITTGFKATNYKLIGWGHQSNCTTSQFVLYSLVWTSQHSYSFQQFNK